MNKPQQYKAKVSEHILINEKFQYLHMELLEPYRIEFEAGQYISIDVGGGERRSYSVASAPAMDHAVEICVDVSPGGKGATFLKTRKPGDEVSFMGPLGQFVIEKSEKEKKLLLIATGSGIAPLRSMVLDMLEFKKEKREMVLHWGLRHVEDMFWEEDFRRFHKYYDNFDFHLTLSKPPDLWPMCSGHVTECVKNEDSLDSSWGAYLCGNKEMIEEVSQLVTEMGIPKDQVHFEKFF